ncbi:MBL fold metallo-hydrolase [Zavarzinella formosa]|uniref:MBL fold metallo-hydrolase n=1 Tax=Zavarzinella formosa TaxID=360055 RepID=UPI000306300F|nr:MBL fold metallo-hydrolase [Zavarzinella formosa]
MSFQIKTIVSMPFAENTYVIWLDGHTDCLVIDPGLEPDLIHEFLADQMLKPVAILNTHGHSDHIAGNGDVKTVYPEAPLIIGVNDAPMLLDPDLNLSRQYGFDIISPPADQIVREGEQLLFAGLTLDIFDCPGHSPGHVVFYLKEFGVLIGGDVLFRGSIGRTDFPGGSFEQLAVSIRNKLYTLPAETVVYPGHGPTTKIGHERRTNRFVTDLNMATE